jgi:hypothetical protein
LRYRGLHDTNGELFAYVEGTTLYTLEGEVTGRIEGNFVVDADGNPVWLIRNHGVYTLDESRSIGYFSGATPEDT